MLCLQSVFDRGYGVVLDSGTTFSYVPTAAFTAFSAAVGKYAESKGLQRTSGADPQVSAWAHECSCDCALVMTMCM